MARAAPLLMNKVCDRNSYILCESLFCPARHSASCQDKHFTHSSLLSVFSCKRDLLDFACRGESLLLSSTSNVQLVLNTQDLFLGEIFCWSFKGTGGCIPLSCLSSFVWMKFWNNLISGLRYLNTGGGEEIIFEIHILYP
jgi:hypothetical protein